MDQARGLIPLTEHDAADTSTLTPDVGSCNGAASVLPPIAQFKPAKDEDEYDDLDDDEIPGWAHRYWVVGTRRPGVYAKE